MSNHNNGHGHGHSRNLIAATVPVEGGGEKLHWRLRSFWDDLSVRLHPDGISVAARDERTSIDALPTQRRPIQPAPARPRQAAKVAAGG